MENNTVAFYTIYVILSLLLSKTESLDNAILAFWLA